MSDYDINVLNTCKDYFMTKETLMKSFKKNNICITTFKRYLEMSESTVLITLLRDIGLEKAKDEIFSVYELTKKGVEKPEELTYYLGLSKITVLHSEHKYRLQVHLFDIINFFENYFTTEKTWAEVSHAYNIPKSIISKYTEKPDFFVEFLRQLSGETRLFEREEKMTNDDLTEFFKIIREKSTDMLKYLDLSGVANFNGNSRSCTLLMDI